jgi:hypothetical protein
LSIVPRTYAAVGQQAMRKSRLYPSQKPGDRRWLRERQPPVVFFE